MPNNRYRKVMTAYGHPMMIIKLQLAYEDGTSETIVSDASWKVAAGPITYSSIFGVRRMMRLWNGRDGSIPVLTIPDGECRRCGFSLQTVASGRELSRSADGYPRG